jgi:3-methyladenine DNA glycosylase/8-oxoguanine DNA glycosylase
MGKTMRDGDTGVTWIELPADGLDLPVTAAPVAWGKGRWPSVDWIANELIWCLPAEAGGRLIRVRQRTAASIEIAGFGARSDAAAWAGRSLGWGRRPPLLGEPVAAGQLADAPGLRPYASGSITQGVLTSIIGQSISVQAAAVTERRVTALYADGIAFGGRQFYPFPAAEQLASTAPARLRETGLTWRRAEAIVAIARLAADGALPPDDAARADPDRALAALRELPLVGPWTAASALLWGLGVDDAHPTGDVALLRAARRAYDRPEMTLRDLDRLAEQWRPARGWAARALWLMLLGPAPVVSPPERPDIKS